CTGVNLALAGDATAAQLAAQFATVLTYLPPGVRLQLVVMNRPHRAAAWVPAHLAQYQAPPALGPYVAQLADAYQQLLADQPVPDLRFYAVVVVPGPPAPRGPFARRARRQRRLVRDRQQQARALGELDRAVAGVQQTLAQLGVPTTPLGRQATIDLLWMCLNPAWSQHATAPRAAGHEVHPPDLRSLRERLAQSRLTRRTEYLRLDWGYETTLSLRALPELTFPGWLAQLTASGVAFRFALHIVPLPKARERTALTRRLRQRHGVLAERDQQGLPPDLEQRQAYQEAEQLLTAMSAGDLRTFRTAVFVTVRAGSPEALAGAAGQVVRALGDAGGTSIDRCQFWQLPAWGATLPLAHNPAGLTYRTITTNLADSLPFLRHSAGTRGGPLIGFSQPGHEVVPLDMFDPALPNGNLIVCGTSGSGKTLFAQTYALKHLALGGRVLVLDRSTDHWADLVAAVGDAELHQVSLGSGLRLNPWQLPAGVREPGQAKVQYLLDLHQLLLGEEHDGVRQLTTTETALLEGACRAVYGATPTPRERDLYAWLRDQAQAAEDTERRQRYDSLAERLLPYVEDGTYAGLLDGPTTVRSAALLTVFNFKHLSDRLVPLVMLPLIEHIWQVVADPTKPILLILDEGWKLLEHPASARLLAEVARTGRHHGLVSLNLSQFITDYTGPTGQAILQNAAVALLLQQHPTLLPTAQTLFGLTDDERLALGRLSTVKGVKAGAYLYAESGAQRGLVDLVVTPVEYWLCTSDPAEQRLRQRSIARHAGDIWAAIADLAAQTSPPRTARRTGQMPALASDGQRTCQSTDVRGARCLMRITTANGGSAPE
ncbi:MAG TPA: hypothetical protein VFU72_12260, partial [Nitrolancea sp.]|nr:hypothetical protein [Nitrolancea sp.]